MNKNANILIVGAGIVGLAIARELRLRGFKSIRVLEKEKTIGVHASGRNSGVVHAGIYYSQDSLKARFCRNGAQKLIAFAKDSKVLVKTVGKVIVCDSPESLVRLKSLYQLGLKNGAPLKLIDENELSALEPMAKTYQKAIHSPETASIDSKGALIALEQYLSDHIINIEFEHEVTNVDQKNKSLTAGGEVFPYDLLINVAGLQADLIAHMFGVGKEYKILPFKGLYWKLNAECSKKFSMAIYPVPDPRVPFLGVHLTPTVFGDVLVGPTAIPAFGRENYQVFKGIDMIELPGILTTLASMYLANRSGMRELVHQELIKYKFAEFLKTAQALAPKIKDTDFLPTTKVGLRAQLYHRQKKSLEMDFVIRQGPDSIHILNAVSPGFTSSFAFAEQIANEYL